MSPARRNMEKKKVSKSWVVTLMLTMFSALSGQTYQFQELVSQALESSPVVKAAGHTVREKDRSVQVERAKFMPSVSATASSIFDNRSGANTSQLKFSGSQKILDPVAVVENRLARTQKEISEVSQKLDQDKVREGVEVVFPRAWLEQERQAFIDCLAKASQLLFDKDRREGELGLLSKVQVLSSVSRLKESKKRVSQYFDQLDSIFAELEKTVGIEILGGPNQEDRYPKLTMSDQFFKVPDRAICLDLAHHNRKELTITQNQIDIEEGRAKAAISGYIPTISGVAFADGLKDPLFGNETKWNSRAGITASWNFFDGASKRFQSEAADARRLKVSQDLDYWRIRINTQVAKALDSAQEKEKEFDWRTTKLREQKEVFERKTTEKKLGLISRVVWQQAELDWLKAQFDWLSSRVDFWVASNQLKASCGYPENWSD